MIHLPRRTFSPLCRVSSFYFVPKTRFFATLEQTTKFEEEQLPHYDANVYYPVHIGHLLHQRYQVLSKLCFGATSTVWFAMDLQEHNYVALKICISSSRPNREVEVLRHLAAIEIEHTGSVFIRTMKDTFEVEEPTGRHQCLVQEPLLASLADLRGLLKDRRLPEQVVKTAMQQVFAGLDYLHTQSHVVHTDLQATNILFTCEDPTIFEDWERVEQEDPSPCKVDGNRVIYQSREFNLLQNMRGVGRCVIADLGAARIGLVHEGFIQPRLYRAPEVTLCMPWGPPADIWNAGVLVCGLSNSVTDCCHHCGHDMLAEMIAFMGAPPSDFLERADETLTYWNMEGQWRSFADIPSYGLEDIEVCLEGENKQSFIRFMRKMLQWKPEHRSTASELLQDEWLNTE
ncbi:kinase-like protein [Tothia fuscella]|uniref:non-specific serine/threonine protein kinase n=1 Tax=Tothia fuscella TaxID=1048955 RepID=A0A9P4P474_9PEZI|nr:kinase-like protein [Tothia fuscella]